MPQEWNPRPRVKDDRANPALKKFALLLAIALVVVMAARSYGYYP